MNSILAVTLGDGVVDADLFIEPSNVEESQTKYLVAAHSTKSTQVGNRVAPREASSKSDLVDAVELKEKRELRNPPATT